MERHITLRVTENLYEQLNRAIEVHEKRTGVALTVSDFIRAAVSEKILKGK